VTWVAVPCFRLRFMFFLSMIMLSLSIHSDRVAILCSYSGSFLLTVPASCSRFLSYSFSLQVIFNSSFALFGDKAEFMVTFGFESFQSIVQLFNSFH
jgi:hypothetical protein